MNRNEKELVCSMCGATFAGCYEPKTPRCPACKAKRKTELHREYMAIRRSGVKAQREAEKVNAENAKTAALSVEAANHHMSYGAYMAAKRMGKL